MLVLLFLLPTPLVCITTSTLEASKSVAQYAQHYQPIMNTLARENKLVELQHRQHSQEQREPVFLSSVQTRASRRLEDSEIFYFENSREIQKQDKTSSNTSDLTENNSESELTENSSKMTENSLESELTDTRKLKQLRESIEKSGLSEQGEENEKNFAQNHQLFRDLFPTVLPQNVYTLLIF